MMKKFIIILILIFHSLNYLYCQDWNRLESEYTSLIKSKSFELAEKKARELYKWVSENKKDSIIYSAISLKYIGNSIVRKFPDSSLVLYNQALELIKEKYKNHVLSAQLHFNIGNIKLNKGEYIDAEEEFYLVLEHPKFELDTFLRFSVISKLEEIAAEYLSIGTSLFIEKEDYTKAYCYFDKINKIYQKANFINGYYAAASNFWIANIHVNSINYIYAEEHFQICLKELESNKLKIQNELYNSFFYAAHNGLGNVRYHLGFYKKAISDFYKTYEFYKLKNDTLELLYPIVSIASCYYEDDNYLASENFIYSNINYFSSLNKNNITQYLDLMNILILIEFNKSNSTDLKKYCNEIVFLNGRYYGVQSKEYLDAKMTEWEYTKVYNSNVRMRKDIDKLFKLAKNIYKSPEEFAKINLKFGHYYFIIEAFDRAEKCFKNYFESNLNNDNILEYYRGNYLLYYLETLKSSKKYSKFVNYFKKYNDLNYNYLLNNSIYLNEIEKEEFWRADYSKLNYGLFCASIFNNDIQEINDIAYNNILFLKSFLLQSNLDKFIQFKTHDNISLINVFKNYKKLNIEIANSELSEVIKNDYQFKIKKRDSLDNLLSRYLMNVDEYKKNFQIKFTQIEKNLLMQEASIEFISYYNYEDSTDYYIAFVLKKTDNHPILVKLCKENQLKDLSPKDDLDKLYDLLWKPLIPYLENVNTVYYSPSGLLNNIPFHALYTEVNGQLKYVMDDFTLHQLTSTRYLALDLKKKEFEPVETSITLVGGINYNDYPEINTDTTQNKIEDASYLYQLALSENNQDTSRAGVSYLPGTKTEVKNIAKILNDDKWEVEIIEDKNASENSIKSYSGKSKSILHIATHGFAYPDKEEIRRDMGIEITQGKDRYKLADNPMIRSGLLFSGANQTLMGAGDSLLNKTGEDGVLTALELSQMDLTNTKVAVLSACETGRGAIQGSEGTFGLKRALKLAGVENMIVSLWKVNDQSTTEMMTIFYSELVKTKNPVKSFEIAQKEMRIKYPDDPHKWAGFVFVR